MSLQLNAPRQQRPRSRRTMNQRERMTLITESNKAMNGLAVWFAVAIVALLIIVINVSHLSPTVAIVVISSFSFGLFMATLFALKYARLNGLMWQDEQPADDASDALLYETEIPQPTVRLYQSDNNVIRVGQHQFTRRQWRTLAHVLKESNWRWTRHILGKAKVVKSLTAPGVYRDMTNDFERLGIVDKGRVTADGRDAICEAAGLDVVI